MEQRAMPAHAFSPDIVSAGADEAPILRFLTCGSVDDGNTRAQVERRDHE